MLSLSKYSSEYPHSLQTYLSNSADDRVDDPIMIALPASAGILLPGIIIILSDPHFGHFPLIFIFFSLTLYGSTLLTLRIFLIISLAKASDPGIFGWVLSAAR